MSQKVNKYIQEVALPMKAIFKDMLKYAPSKIFGLLGNIVVVPVYTNLLSPSQYGVYVISLAVLSFLCILFSDLHPPAFPPYHLPGSRNIGQSAFRQSAYCHSIRRQLPNEAHPE